jgi:hypothetical protein
MKNFILAAALAAGAAACAPLADPQPCGTPSPCPAISFACNSDLIMPVFLDYEPAPWGPEVIESCWLFPGKKPAQAAPICAVLDTTAQPWQLRIWSDSVTLYNDPGIEPYFCLDEYTGHSYSYFSGDTMKVDLRNYEQVRHYLDTQEQIQFVIEIHCPD